MGGRGSGSGLAPTPQPIIQPLSDIEKYLGPQGNPEDMPTAISKSNPYFNQSTRQFDYKYTHNCQRCVWATELRARGYNVEAMPRGTYTRHDGTVVPDRNDSQYAMMYHQNGFPNAGATPVQIETVAYKATSSANLVNTIKGLYPDGSRGMIIGHRAKSGHVFNWEYKNGKVTFYDGQANYSPTAVQVIREYKNGLFVGRMDNIGLSDKLKIFVRPSGGAY